MCIFIPANISLLFLNKEVDNSIIENKIESNSFTNEAISWSIAPFFMPFLGNIFIRIILLSKGDQLISIINYANKILVLVNAFTFSIILVGYQKAVTAKNESIDLFKDDINLNIKRIVYLLVPISIFISFNSEFIIKVIFERGNLLLKQLYLLLMRFQYYLYLFFLEHSLGILLESMQLFLIVDFIICLLYYGWF